MLLPRDQLLNLPIMSLQTGTQIGTVVRHIIDPRRLEIVAFYCEGPMIDYHPAILHTTDIREFSSIGLIVDSADNIMPPDDLVRLKEIIDFNFVLEGKQVLEDHGRKLGKVESYTVDNQSFFIIKLQVRPTLFQSLSQAEFLVDRSQIKEVNDRQIVVRSATVKDQPEQRFAPMPPIDNPFRKQHLPEAHGSDDKNRAENPHPS